MTEGSDGRATPGTVAVEEQYDTPTIPETPRVRSFTRLGLDEQAVIEAMGSQPDRVEQVPDQGKVLTALSWGPWGSVTMSRYGGFVAYFDGHRLVRYTVIPGGVPSPDHMRRATDILPWLTVEPEPGKSGPCAEMKGSKRLTWRFADVLVMGCVVTEVEGEVYDQSQGKMVWRRRPLAADEMLLVAAEVADGSFYGGTVDWRVKEAQSLLRELGRDPGPVDGVTGHKTESALKAFQEQVGVPADGVVSDTILRALRRQVAVGGQPAGHGRSASEPLRTALPDDCGTEHEQMGKAAAPASVLVAEALAQLSDSDAATRGSAAGRLALLGPEARGAKDLLKELVGDTAAPWRGILAGRTVADEAKETLAVIAQWDDLDERMPRFDSLREVPWEEWLLGDLLKSGDSFSVHDASYGDLTGDGQEEAVVVTYEELSSFARVFRLEDGRPISMGTVSPRRGGFGRNDGLHVVGIDDMTLVLENLWWREDDPACCPSATRRTGWRWRCERMRAAWYEDLANRE